MRACEASLLARVRITVADAGAACVHVGLDGWPLLLVDLDARTVAVNDLRRSAMFAHAAAIPATGCEVGVRAGAVGDELYLLVGDGAAVFVAVGGDHDVHAEVKLVESATGRLLLERTVRYRQLPVGSPAWPGTAAVGE